MSSAASGERRAASGERRAASKISLHSLHSHWSPIILRYRESGTRESGTRESGTRESGTRDLAISWDCRAIARGICALCARDSPSAGIETNDSDIMAKRSAFRLAIRWRCDGRYDGDTMAQSSEYLAPKPPGHQATKPPSHQATKPPSHQATSPPSHQATKPPAHQPTTSLRKLDQLPMPPLDQLKVKNPCRECRGVDSEGMEAIFDGSMK